MKTKTLFNQAFKEGIITDDERDKAIALFDSPTKADSEWFHSLMSRIRSHYIDDFERLKNKSRKADNNPAGFSDLVTIQQISQLTGYSESYLYSKLKKADIEAAGKNIYGSNLYEKQEVIDGIGFK